MIIRMFLLLVVVLGAVAGESVADAAFLVSDYDAGSVYLDRESPQRAIPGMTAAWTGNRALRWLGPTDLGGAGLLVTSEGGDLPLTGERAVSTWHASGADTIAQLADGVLRGRKLSTDRAWALFALPPLEIHLGQYPRLIARIQAADRPWQVVVAIKGRSGPPLFTTPWKQGPADEVVPIAELLTARGYEQSYAQIQVILAVKTPAAADPAELSAVIAMPAVPAVVAGLPMIRTQGNPLPIAALPVGADGRPLDATVTATIAGAPVALTRQASGAWTGTVAGQALGAHRVRFTARWAGGTAAADQLLVVTSGVATTYDPATRSLVRGGKRVGPQTGSYRGMPMFADIGTTNERLVHGAKMWAEVKGREHEGQHGNHGGPRYGFHAWEALTPAELDRDYAYLRASGVDLIHLCQGWWTWDRWDAGGHLAPHAAEQLARTIASAHYHGLHLYLALSHYPLGWEADAPTVYQEAGYRPERRKAHPQLADAASPYWTLYGAYLRDLAGFLVQASPVAMVSASGEGDRSLPAAFLELTRKTITDAGWSPWMVTEDRDERWEGSMQGTRCYAIDLNARDRLDQIPLFYRQECSGPRRFLAEGVFWGYSKGAKDTAAYRRRVRHVLYTGFVRQVPILMTWEERIVEDERRILAACRARIDWSTRWRAAPLVLTRGGNQKDFPAALGALGLDYDWVIRQEPTDRRPALEGDADPAAVVAALPAAIRAAAPLVPSDGWRAETAVAEDGSTVLSFLTRDLPGAGSCRIQVAGPEGRVWRAWDLDRQAEIGSGAAGVGAEIALPADARDVLVVIHRPVPAGP